jgi:8-oxo-dGTP diphosphatase
MKPTFTIGAFAIITDSSNRILLCLRTDCNIWNLPGGAVESGEAPWDAVVREVNEETGLEVTVDRLIGLYSKPQDNDLVFSYQCRVVSGSITATAEAKEIAYFPLDELPENIISKQLARIHDYSADRLDIVMAKQL